MKIAFFSAGTIGAGHLMRGIAIRRALARLGFSGEWRAFVAPNAFVSLQQRMSATVVPIVDDPDVLDPRLSLRSSLATELQQFDPDLLLVDLFWAPLRWIVPELRGKTWLLGRRCPSTWWHGVAGHRFVAQHFEKILAIEPGLVGPFTEEIEPIVAINPDERAPAGTLRAALNWRMEDELRVWMHAGAEGESQRIARIVPDYVRLDLRLQNVPHLAARLLGDANAILTGSGYNTFWEIHWLDFVAKTRFLAFPRSIDCQTERRRYRGYPMRENGADILARMCLDLS